MTTHLTELLSRAAAESPGRVALSEVSSGRRLSWAELDAQVEQMAQGLDALGMVAGYRVVLAMSNRAEFVVAYLGALRAGLVAVPVNPRSATGETVRIIADCGARLVLADPGTVATVRQAVAGLEDALVGADEELRRRAVVPRVAVVGAPALPGEIRYDDLLAAATGQEVPVPADPESLAVLLYTSGTSARPRAAMLSHRALLANIEQVAATDPPMVTGDDVVLGMLPLFHVYGLNAMLGQVLRQQARLVVVDGFDVQQSLAVVDDEGVTVVPAAPPVLVHWLEVEDLRDRLAGVRTVLSGSAPIAQEVVDAFVARTGVPVHQGYGLTEAAPVVTSTTCSATVKPGSVGRPLPDIELRLVDELAQPPEGSDPGEIVIRGDNLFSGYWPDGADGPDADGWYPTGDLGFLDEDGDLFLVDRLKELVIVSGFNVYPFEVEEVIGELDGVADVAVIGAPNEETGESVVAYVTQRPGSSYRPEQLAAAVREHCEVRLARFKQPREVHVVDELPRTGTGKVAKGRLRARRRHLRLFE